MITSSSNIGQLPELRARPQRHAMQQLCLVHIYVFFVYVSRLRFGVCGWCTTDTDAPARIERRTAGTVLIICMLNVHTLVQRRPSWTFSAGWERVETWHKIAQHSLLVRGRCTSPVQWKTPFIAMRYRKYTIDHLLSSYHCSDTKFSCLW